MSEETVWDKWKREREGGEGEIAIQVFNVCRSEFMHDGKKYTVDVCGPYEDGSWTVEPSWGEDIRLENSDALIDFMMRPRTADPAQ